MPLSQVQTTCVTAWLPAVQGSKGPKVKPQLRSQRLRGSWGRYPKNCRLVLSVTYSSREQYADNSQLILPTAYSSWGRIAILHRLERWPPTRNPMIRRQWHILRIAGRHLLCIHAVPVLTSLAAPACRRCSVEYSAAERAPMHRGESRATRLLAQAPSKRRECVTKGHATLSVGEWFNNVAPDYGWHSGA